MQLDPISEQRLVEVHPVLADKIRLMADDPTLPDPSSQPLRVTQGLRLYSDQAHLYAMGRTIASNAECRHDGVLRPIGTCREHPLGAPVTNAKPGYSHHCFALAVDVVPDNPDMPGFQPDWSDQKLWDKVIAAGEKVGLRSGKSWHDQPHFEWTGIAGPVPPQAWRDVLANGGTIQDVWKLAFPA